MKNVRGEECCFIHALSSAFYWLSNFSTACCKLKMANIKIVSASSAGIVLETIFNALIVKCNTSSILTNVTQCSYSYSALQITSTTELRGGENVWKRFTISELVCVCLSKAPQNRHWSQSLINVEIVLYGLFIREQVRHYWMNFYQYVQTMPSQLSL